MSGTRVKRALDGVLMLDKAPGASSNAVLQQAKRLYEAAKAGHAGTLDPLASGLLPVLFGEATKFSSDLLDADKSYAAEILLGTSTTTADAEGEVLAVREVSVTREQLCAGLSRFHGAILQTPPIYSALKHAGKPLYAYARAGIQIEREPRQVTVHAIELTGFQGDRVALSLTVSKGTYIRSIAHDLGELLGCGAHLVALRRTGVGDFGIECACPLETLQGMTTTERDNSLLPVDALLTKLPELKLESAMEARFVQGQAIPVVGGPQSRVRVYGAGGGLLGVAELGADGLLQPKRMLAQRQPAK